MILELRARLHAAVGVGSLAWIRHAAVMRPERLVARAIVHGVLGSANRQCLKLVRRRVKQAQTNVQMVAHLWIIVSSANLLPKFGRRNFPTSHGVHGPAPDHGVASETESSRSSATSLNQVQNTTTVMTRWARNVASGQFASGSAPNKAVDSF